MLQYNQNMKGATMQNKFLLGISKEVYDIIYETFPEKKQADGIASIMEKVLIQAEIINQADFQNKLEIIVLKVKEKLGEEFATKAELKAALAELELKLMREIGKVRTEIAEVKAELKQEIADLRTELKQEIAEVRDELKDMIKETQLQVTSLATNMQNMQKGFDDKINSFKFYIIKWIVGVGIGIVVASSAITKISSIFWH